MLHCDVIGLFGHEVLDQHLDEGRLVIRHGDLDRLLVRASSRENQLLLPHDKAILDPLSLFSLKNKHDEFVLSLGQGAVHLRDRARNRRVLRQDDRAILPRGNPVLDIHAETARGDIRRVDGRRRDRLEFACHQGIPGFPDNLPGFDGSSFCHRQIRADTAADDSVVAENLTNHLPVSHHPAGAADQDHLIRVPGTDFGCVKPIENDLPGSVHQAREGDNLAVLFSDHLSHHGQERDIGERYHELFHSGDLIEQYDHIMDSLSFQHSHQCCGLQMADFIAGAVVGFLRDFDFSRDVFTLNIFKRIRAGSKDKKLGYGILVVPSRERSRKHLQEKLENVLPF